MIPLQVMNGCSTRILVWLMLLAVAAAAHIHNVQVEVERHQQECDNTSSSLSSSLQLAVADFSRVPYGQDSKDNNGQAALAFLKGLAGSSTFRNEYWQKQPLFLTAEYTGGWIPGCFTVDRDLRLVLDNSYISGHKTADEVRSGAVKDTWLLKPLKDNPTLKTKWSQVEQALQGGTIYFNTAGSLWPTLGGLCRLFGHVFGLPPNVNVYVTPPHMSLSVPPHTDRQDVVVLQTQGCKRWKVYRPPLRKWNPDGKDPMHRGKQGDVLTDQELEGNLVLDIVMRPGDVLYVPCGFPHTTDTISTTNDDNNNDEISVHLTMGLDTHVWCLTWAHLRWAVLQKAGLNHNLNVQDDELYWKSMRALPVGPFLGGWEYTDDDNNNPVPKEVIQEISNQFKSLLIELEPNRWKEDISSSSSNDDGDEREALPDDEIIEEVIDYMISKHWKGLMQTQDDLFRNIDPFDEANVIKAFAGTQGQYLIMEELGTFLGNPGFASSFRQRRLAAEEQLRSVSS